MTTCYLDIANSESVFSPSMIGLLPGSAWLWLFREHLIPAKSRGCDTVILRFPWRWAQDESSALVGPIGKGKARREAMVKALETVRAEGRPMPDLWHYGRLPPMQLSKFGGYLEPMGDAYALGAIAKAFVGETWDASIGCGPAPWGFIEARSRFRPTRLEPLHDIAYGYQHRFPVDVADEVATNPSPSQVIPDPAKLRVWQHKAHPETKAGTLELARLCKSKGWEPCPTLWMFTRQDSEAVTAGELSSAAAS